MQFVTIDEKLMQITNQRSLLAETIVQIMENMANQAETALVSDFIVVSSQTGCNFMNFTELLSFYYRNKEATCNSMRILF